MDSIQNVLEWAANLKRRRSLRHVEMKSTVCSRILFVTMVQKAQSILAKCSISEKFSADGWMQNSEFQVIRKTSDRKAKQNGNRNSKVTQSCEQWTKIEVDSCVACSDKFWRHSDFTFFEGEFVPLTEKTVLCTRRRHHLFLLRRSKHKRNTISIGTSLYTVCNEMTPAA